MADDKKQQKKSPRRSVPEIFGQSMYSIENLISRRNGSGESDGDTSSSRPPTPTPGQEAADATNPSTELSPAPTIDAPDDANGLPDASQSSVPGSQSGNEVSHFRRDQNLFFDDHEADRPDYVDVIPGSRQGNRTEYRDMDFLMGNWKTPPRHSESETTQTSQTFDHVAAAAAHATAFYHEQQRRLAATALARERTQQVSASNVNVVESSSSVPNQSSRRAIEQPPYLLVDTEVHRESSTLSNSTAEKEVQYVADVGSVGVQTPETKLTDNETQTDKTPSFSDFRFGPEAASQPEFMQGCVFGMKMAAAIEKMASNGSLPRTVLTELFSIMEQRGPQQPAIPTTYPALAYQPAQPTNPCAGPSNQTTPQTAFGPQASPYGIPPFNAQPESQQFMSNDYALALQMSQAQYNQMLQSQRYYPAMTQMPMGQSMNPFMFPNINNLLLPQQPRRMMNTPVGTPQQNPTDSNAQRAQDPQPLDEEIIDVGTFTPVSQQPPVQTSDTVQREVPVVPVQEERPGRSILVCREPPSTPTGKSSRTVHFEETIDTSNEDRNSSRNTSIKETSTSDTPGSSTQSASKKRVHQKNTAPAPVNDGSSDCSSGEEEVPVKRSRSEKTSQKSASSTPAARTPKVASKKAKQSDTPKSSRRGRPKTPRVVNEDNSDSDQEEAPSRSASTPTKRRSSKVDRLRIDMHGQQPANETRKKRSSRDFYKAPKK